MDIELVEEVEQTGDHLAVPEEILAVVLKLAACP